MRKPASQGSKLASKGAYIDVSDRRMQVQLTQEAKIASDFFFIRAIFAVVGFVSALTARAWTRALTHSAAPRIEDRARRGQSARTTLPFRKRAALGPCRSRPTAVAASASPECRPTRRETKTAFTMVREAGFRVRRRFARQIRCPRRARCRCSRRARRRA